MATSNPATPRDWSASNHALVQRGALTLWIDPDLLHHWAGDRQPRRRGRPHDYSAVAIQLLLTLRACYGLTLRQTEGFARSLFALLALDLPVPDYSTLSRRAATLTIDLGATAAGAAKTILVDSTGVKVFGEGEWKVRQHGYAYRRVWRQLHLGVNAATLEIEAVETTTHAVSDGSQMEPLLAAVPGEIEAVKADGAYDQAEVYAVVNERDAAAVIPPRQGAVIHQHGNCAAPPLPRDENLRGVRRYGRRGWKKKSGYHERSLVETTMYRFKITFGDQRQSRTLATQKTENRIKCRILNKYTQLGMLGRSG